jgi:hypothetical protein
MCVAVTQTVVSGCVRLCRYCVVCTWCDHVKAGYWQEQGLCFYFVFLFGKTNLCLEFCSFHSVTCSELLERFSPCRDPGSQSLSARISYISKWPVTGRPRCSKQPTQQISTCNFHRFYGTKLTFITNKREFLANWFQKLCSFPEDEIS